MYLFFIVSVKSVFNNMGTVGIKLHLYDTQQGRQLEIL